MKTFYNEPADYVSEMLEGIVAAHSDTLAGVPGEPRGIMRADAPTKGKVAIVTGGGSGHLPVFLGYVGKGLLDGASVGNIFASPSINQMLNVTKAVDGGSGVLYLYGNYGGDVMNFDMAAEEAEDLGIDVQSIRVADDIASAPKGEEAGRRGVAGLFYAYKVAGAAAELGSDLTETCDITRRALDNIRSLGVAISPCTLPGSGKPSFQLEENEMEIGMGIHGEAGIVRGERTSADQVTEHIMDLLSQDTELHSGEEVSVLVNSLGATPLEELYIIYRRITHILKDAGVGIFKPFIGRYATSMEMAGFSVTLFRVDDELKRYLDYPASSPFIAIGAS